MATAFVLTPDVEVEAQLADFADEPNPDVRRRSELAAEKFVVAALKEEGYPEDRIERVGHLKIGFDIRSPELVRIENPAVRLDHAKREIVAARFFEIPAEAVIAAGQGGS